MNMKRKISHYLLFSLLICLSSFSVGCGQSGNSNTSSAQQTDTLKPTNQWFTLAPNIDEFSVEMPGLTTSITQAYPNTYVYKNSGRVYLLIVYPIAGEDKKSSDEEILDRYGKTFSKSMVEGFGKVEPPQPQTLSLNGTPGREYRLSGGSRVSVRRLYLREKRLYSLEASAPVSEMAFVDRFLNSFTFEREKPLQFLEPPSQKKSNVPLGDPVLSPSQPKP